MKYFVFLVLFLLPVVMPDSAQAAGLVPCGGPSEQPCTACHLIDLGNNVIGWLIGVLMVVFAIIAVAAGFGLVTSGGNTQAKEDAKKKMTNAIIGLIIVLAGWLIVDTVMRALLSGEDGVLDNGTYTGTGPWSEIECAAQPTPTPPTPPGPTPTPTPTPGPGDGDAVRATLAAAGVSINRAQECPEGVPYQSAGFGCTSVGGFNQGTIDAIVAMRQACGTQCPSFTVTGGSELGHAGGTNPGSHGGGDKFDLRTSDVQSFMMGNTFVNGVQGRRGNARVSTTLGVSCIREGAGTTNDHWDCLAI